MKKIRLPVSMKGGKLTCVYDGSIPIVDGAVGELIVDADSITDPDFLNLLKKKSRHMLLPAGENLLVALTIKPYPKLSDHLLEQLEDCTNLGAGFRDTFRPGLTKFVRIRVGTSTDPEWTLKLDQAGGIWLEMEGQQAKSVSTTSIELPAVGIDENVDSLNHAFTLLSEVFEPWRKSHTGNIYDRILYQEANGAWYPISVLRNLHEAKEWHERARACWLQIKNGI